MKIVTIQAARTSLSRRVAEVKAGEETVLARRKVPVAKLVPFHVPAAKRRFGTPRGQISVGPEIFAPLPEEEQAAWET